MSRVFVTGATGVAGRRVLPLLLAAGHDVTAVVRSPTKAEAVRRVGVTPVHVDLSDPTAIATAVAGHDAITHLATNIPTGASAATKRGWRTNDQLRSVVAAALARAAVDVGVERYVQESITFPYVDARDSWIDETARRTYFWGNRTTVDAEQAATQVTAAGGSGVVLRFGMFTAEDSAHMQTISKVARRGIWGVFGDDDAYISFVAADDAAAAVVAALGVPPGVYNVAEAEPTTRGAHRADLAAAVGRPRLRHLPGLVETMGGAGAESLARSQRISSAALRTVSAWRPEQRGIDIWRRVA